MICTTFADRVSLTWNHGKYKWNIPLGRNNLQIVRSNPEYDVSNSTTTNPWSNQIIKAYYSYIPKEVSNKQYHTLMPSTMKHNIDEQPKLRKCDSTKDLYSTKGKYAYHLKIFNIRQKFDTYLEDYQAFNIPNVMHAC
jgi:hypothetical protein